MEINKLRSIIKEAVDAQLKEIEAVAENAAMEARLAEYDKAIKMCEDKIATAENLEEIKDLVDEGKIKEIKNKLKSLQKAKDKLEKAKAKKNKGKEVVTDEPVEDAEVEEGAGPGSTNYNMGDDAANVNYEEGGDPDFYVDETINESFLKMQKLAGVITEAQYNEKKK
jgi:alanyl-tRNA synthetase